MTTSANWRGVKHVAARLLPPIATDAIRKVLRAARTPAPRPGADLAATVTDAVPEAAVDVGPAAPAAPPVVPNEPPEWEIVENTDAVWASPQGWSHASIVDVQKARWPAFLDSVRGAGVLGRSHFGPTGAVDLALHNTLMTFGYALGRTCASRAAVKVLDWGGGMGHYAVYARSLFPDVRFDFHVKDMAGLCAAGREVLPDVAFTSDDDEALGDSYDFVLASASVQYARDPYALVARLCAATRDRLLVTRSPFMQAADDVLVVQRPHSYGYMTEYPGWIINQPRLVSRVAAEGFDLERQFLIGEQPHLPGLPEPAQYYGLLFRRVPAG